MIFAFRTMVVSGIVWGLAASSFAIPFASQIKTKDTTVSPGAGTQISYFLNEAAESVTVALTDEGTTVASFAGPASQGHHVLNWNGTVDNGGGASITSGDLQITVTATASHTTWTEIAGNASGAMLPPLGTNHQLFTGFMPNDCLFVSDRESEFFGMAFADVSNAESGIAAVIPMNSDTSTADGSDGFASRIFRSATLEEDAKDTSLWGMSNDPDNPNIFYITGQANGSGNRFLRGDLASSGTLVSADPDHYLDGFSPRTVRVVREGLAKYAYFCASIDLYKAPINPVTNDLAGSPILITDFATPNRYARGVDIDAAGNVYFVSKQTSSGKGGALFRWDANRVAGPTPMLSEELAAWQVTCPDSMIYMMGPAITPHGDVYVAMISGGQSGKITGIFHVGNAGTALLTKTLSAQDSVVDFSAIGEPPVLWAADTLSFSLRSDPVGNLLAIDSETQQVRLFSPPGNSGVSVMAPGAESIRVGAGVEGWASY